MYILFKYWILIYVYSYGYIAVRNADTIRGRPREDLSLSIIIGCDI